MDKDILKDLQTRRVASFSTRLRGLALFALVVFTSLQLLLVLPGLRQTSTANLPLDAAHIVSRCANLNTKPHPPADFARRVVSDRFVPGTKPTLVKNARIWTGGDSGLETIKGDILLDQGIIRSVGSVPKKMINRYPKGLLQVVEAHGAWVSPGIVDLHSHIGDDASPALRGAADTNSVAGLTLPWMRSLDGLNTHDDSYQLSVAGGVTTSLVLPGSADAIGGQAFPIKLRPTAERSPTSMLIELPYTLNGTDVDPSLPPRWRHMKHACGENPSRVYHGTRMDTIWAFRQAYDKARQIKEAQDDYCDAALSGQWSSLAGKKFPEELQWEALVDVLRGRVKVNVHCYEAVDLDDIVRLTNEFKFPVAAFHHAHETYLVPEVLKRTYGGTPAVAIFATHARYKREAYRGSEFTARILAENDIRPIMKSDHPVTNSRYLLYEAQLAHYFGLPEHLALASVTSVPADAMGMGHRLGLIKEGYDADLVIWDSHPLALGATPKQVWIDGIPQLASPHVVKKPSAYQTAPETPNFDQEAKDAVEYDGLPPLEAKKKDAVLFLNVKSVLAEDEELNILVEKPLAVDRERDGGVVAVRFGEIVCAGSMSDCQSALDRDADYEIVDLEGGTITPGLLSFGSPLGLSEIPSEASTSDGSIYDSLTNDMPALLGGVETIIRAVDGLIYSTRNALLAYRSGVTSAVTAPIGNIVLGVSTAFSTGAAHKLEEGAIVQETVAVHVDIQARGVPSVSSQIAALRQLLLGGGDGEASSWFKRVREGDVPLVVMVHSADVMATLLSLKKEVDRESGKTMQLTFAGATEAHLIASHIGKAGVGVIVAPSRPFPSVWSMKRILPGPPLTEENAVRTLLAHNVTVGLGVLAGGEARNTRFDAGWTALEADGAISRPEAYALVSTNMERLLGIHSTSASSARSNRTGKRLGRDLVATRGGDLLSFEGKVVGVLSPRRAVVDLF